MDIIGENTNICGPNIGHLEFKNVDLHSHSDESNGDIRDLDMILNNVRFIQVLSDNKG